LKGLGCHSSDQREAVLSVNQWINATDFAVNKVATQNLIVRLADGSDSASTQLTL
jgi:hypothetical protein